MTIKEWQKEVHKNAVEHGWWQEERGIGELLMLTVSECSEAMEEIRNGRDYNETYFVDEKMKGFPSEVADIVIRVMDLCEHYGVDLEKAIEQKHEFNKTRPFKHGGKKF